MNDIHESTALEQSEEKKSHSSLSIKSPQHKPHIHLSQIQIQEKRKFLLENKICPIPNQMASSLANQKDQ
jgi:hypothetical protein